MSPPTVRVNTLFTTIPDPNLVDKISKIFFFIELPLAIIRFPIYTTFNTIYWVLVTAYCLTFMFSVVSYGAFLFVECHFLSPIFLALVIFQYAFIVLYNLIRSKQLKPFYKEINNFDLNAKNSFEPHMTTLKNVWYMCLLIVYIIFIVFLPYFMDGTETVALPFAPMVLSNVIELHFFGHLLSLLITRLRYINYCLRCRTLNADYLVFSTVSVFKTYEIEKLMKLYYVIIRAYDYMVEAIRWQFLVILITSFFNLLCCSYYISLSVIRENSGCSYFKLFLFQVVGIVGPLLSPCTLAGQMHGEVLHLRELLTCRLYENRLDKGSRSVMRALLSWTKTRDLKFRLLRMFTVDLALPFKFIGLLVTYLIIILQFEKVIDSIQYGV